jgi:hypothetical protein
VTVQHRHRPFLGEQWRVRARQRVAQALDLLHAAGFHEHHTRGQALHFLGRVGDVQDGNAGFQGQSVDQRQQFGLGPPVQGGQRFVH